MNRLAPPITILLLLMLGACGARTVAHSPTEHSPRGEAASGISYSFHVDPPERGASLRVCVRVATAPTPLPVPLRFALPSEWGGRSGFEDDIRNIEATGRLGEPLPVRVEQNVANVQHDALDDVALCYDVDSTFRIASEISRFRSVFSAMRFYAPGHAILAVPLGVSPQLLLSVSTDAVAAAEPWGLNSSVDIGGTPARLRQLVEASYFAGPWNRASHLDRDASTEVAVDPALTLEPAALAQKIAAVVESQRSLLDLRMMQNTTVVVLRREDDPGAMTGNGREGGFTLELGSDVDPQSDEFIELVAHENLHRLIGHALTFSPDEELATLWFREGLTDYLAIRQAVAHDLLPVHRLFLRIGGALTQYRGNPEAASGGVSVERYRESRDLRRLPYDKGALLALLIDLQLRDGGYGDLPGWIVFLRDDASSRMLPLTNSALRDSLERYSGVSWSDFWQRYVTGSEPLAVNEALRRAGIEVIERLQPAPWFGLRVGSTSDGRWSITEVISGSPADLAGLRAGQPLASEPFIPDDAGLGSARVLLGDDIRGARSVVVAPALGQRRAYVLRAIEEGNGYLAHFGLSAVNAQ